MSSYTIPNVIASSPRGDRVMDVYSHLLSERIVYLGTEIDDGVSNALIAQILHLESVAPDQEINLYINSPGGSLTATFAVYDAMQFVRSPVATTCVGQACSTAAILLAAGAPGKRSVLPHSRVLLHQPSGSGRGAIPDIILAADEVIRLRAEAEEVLAHHTGQPVDVLRKDTDRDQIFTPQAAVDYGLADEVMAYRS
ncbi:putative ATP-dependent Clp protease proteolytic subunit-like protein [Flexivirga endophytica]|uniref:ATP-dependent Clp protease proteolytic subunit n=1 Tax=Flexivirga endophytica TaxID=1849103 RepID=A0A916TI39_9MICO|nr:ATP-dependent Clp protease proteolytic subunit [Flexivirga endophytica]GGB46706.1 putative ATP-dependent Clp protease proteolytic subunit-like protein [Flexivirga endophytica]GHB70752.1 putative ATP-dependent Clp protease proteolytic subunit-like protein [Flexivirga endophytica]